MECRRVCCRRAVRDPSRKERHNQYCLIDYIIFHLFLSVILLPPLWWVCSLAALLSRPQTNLMAPHFNTIWGSVQLFQLHMLILLGVTHDPSSRRLFFFFSPLLIPNPPFLALSATPKLQISPSWDWHRKPPAPCWRNYLCITLNLSINKRFFSPSVPKIPVLQRKWFILSFVLFCFF